MKTAVIAVIKREFDADDFDLTPNPSRFEAVTASRFPAFVGHQILEFLLKLG